MLDGIQQVNNILLQSTLNDEQKAAAILALPPHVIQNEPYEILHTNYLSDLVARQQVIDYFFECIPNLTLDMLRHAPYTNLKVSFGYNQLLVETFKAHNIDMTEFDQPAFAITVDRKLTDEQRYAALLALPADQIRKGVSRILMTGIADKKMRRKVIDHFLKCSPDLVWEEIARDFDAEWGPNLTAIDKIESMFYLKRALIAHGVNLPTVCLTSAHSVPNILGSDLPDEEIAEEFVKLSPKVVSAGLIYFTNTEIIQDEKSRNKICDHFVKCVPDIIDKLEESLGSDYFLKNLNIVRILRRKGIDMSKVDAIFRNRYAKPFVVEVGKAYDYIDALSKVSEKFTQNPDDKADIIFKNGDHVYSLKSMLKTMAENHVLNELLFSQFAPKKLLSNDLSEDKARAMAQRMTERAFKGG